jgi:hypothetical protein
MVYDIENVFDNRGVLFMEIRDRVRKELLELGAENLRAYRQAKLESSRSGAKAARDKQLQAALLYHGICQMAEFLGVSSYDEFDREIRRLIL